MLRKALIVAGALTIQGCASFDTATTLRTMYNLPSSGASEFDGSKYVRVRNMVCSNSVVIELYQDSPKHGKGLVILNAGSKSITNIGEGDSLLFSVDGEKYSFKAHSILTDHDRLNFGQGVTAPFSHKSYLVPEAFIRKAALSHALLTRVHLLNGEYIEGKCSPVTLQEAMDENKGLGVEITQEHVDSGNSVAAVYGFREFVKMIDATPW